MGYPQLVNDTDGQDVEAYYQEDQEKENGIPHAYDEPPPAYIVVKHVEPGEKKAYFAWSIFSIFCCCVFVGIPALTFSIRTNAANDIKNWARAKRFSRYAQGFNIMAMVCGAGLWFVLIIAILVHHGWTIQELNNIVICNANPSLDMCQEEE